MNILELETSLFLGKGRERACYIHPEDHKKVVKVVYRLDQKLNQNEMEYKYIKYLHKNGVNFSHLTDCYGCINTNLGLGYIFDRVLDYDGKQSESFKFMVLNSLLSQDEELKLLEELKKYLFKNNIIFVDIALSNILCKKINQKSYKLILTDGIGGKRNGFKAMLYQYSKIYTKYKIIKQWNKLILRYRKVSSKRCMSI